MNLFKKKMMLKSAIGFSIVLTIFCAQVFASSVTSKEIVQTYADIAHAMYEDSLLAGQELSKKINQFLANPTERNLQQAKIAWLASRVPYQQTEVYRFGNVIVDDWEGKVNAWPLDEGLIDYVDASYGMDSEENPLYTANVIANKSLMIKGKQVDASQITKELLQDTLHEGSGVEANVAIGYHAIEFLLWGQDLNGTKAGAGNRPATDYDLKNCTHGNCDRRAQYLKVVTEILVEDLEEMVANWTAEGAARQVLLKNPDQGIETIVKGIGSLSYGELAGERMKLGLMLHDPEEEHDCFADNTHNSHYYNVVGIMNVYNASYTRTDGSVVSGPSLAMMAKSKNPAVYQEMNQKLMASFDAASVMKRIAESGKAYDQMLAEGDKSGNQVLDNLVDALKDQTRTLKKLVASLDLKSIAFEGSDSLDNPSAVK